MKIKIHNPNLLRTIDYRKLQPLQGNLKDLSEANYKKLKNVLIKRGFTAPFYIWVDTSQHYLVDGHQRLRVMTKENMEPYEVPYIEIKAIDRADAKAQLLEISSQFGKITQEGFDEFTDELQCEEFENIAFDALPLVGTGDDNEEAENNNDESHAIIISFSDVAELDKCLIDVQEVCEKYGSAQIKVKE